MQKLTEYLAGKSYPGRGIFFGADTTGNRAVIAYFIMGRSVNSRNRVFVEQPDGGIITKAFDESKLVDPSLIIYAPVRVPARGLYIVTNGDQTDTVRDYLAAGKTFEEALRTRTYEPDAPNYTPRISGLVRAVDGAMDFRLSILKRDGNEKLQPLRCFYEYQQPDPGTGCIIHTYMEDGEPLPSYRGEPAHLSFDGELDSFTADVWNALNEDNKVSLYTCFIDCATGEAEHRIVNKLQA